MAERGMRLSEVLRAEQIVVPLEVATVREAVHALVQRLVEDGSVVHPERLDRVVAEDRIRDVIHVGHRVLLPHVRTDAVTRLVVALGVSPSPLRTAPGEPEGTEQIVVLVLAPPIAANLYLQLVAALARALRSDAVTDRLLAASSPAEVLEIPELRDLVVQPRLTVRDVMTQRVYRVQPDTPVRELIELMTTHEVRAIPVVGEKREVLGIVTDRDLLRHLLPRVVRAGGAEREEAAAEGLGDVRVRDIMSRSVMCISEEQSLAEVASIMVNKETERLPVVSEGKLTGFLTRGDIIRKLFGT